MLKQHMMIQFLKQRLIVGCMGAIGLFFLIFSQPLLAQSSSVKGTGGSAATRILTQWNFLSAKELKINVSYATAVSDVGIREIIARNVDFACSEIPLTPNEIKKNDLVQFPLLIGGVVPIINVPGVKAGEMRLNVDLLASIYMGKIKSWDDERIRSANPTLKLPRLPIRLIAREEPASTTLAFTTHLANGNSAWRSGPGINKLPAWPVPVERVVSTQGMGEMVKNSVGAIGYINFDEAFRGRLVYTQLKNRAGSYLVPQNRTFQATAVQAGLARAGEQLPLLIDVDGADSWPIVYVTYVLLDRRPKDVERARSTLRFFYWVFLQGDNMAAESGFVPLPISMQARIVGSFREVLGPNNAPIEFLR